jgi:type IV secretion system protein VirB6
VFDAIDTPLVNAVNGILTALTGYVDGPLKAFVTFALAAGALVVAIRPDVLPLNWLFANLIRAAVVIFLVANVGNFNQYVGNLFLQILPNEIGNAINGTLSGGGAPINGGAQFDTVWNHTFTSGLVVYDNLPSMSLKGAFLAIVVFAYWGAALAAIGIGFLIFVAAHVLLALEIAIGPLFVATFAFPATRHFFSGWLSAVVSTLLSQILIVALMSLMIRVELRAGAQLMAQPAGANVVGQMGALLGVGALLFICALLAKQIPSVATGIAHGVYHNTNAYTAALWTGTKGVARATTGVVRSYAPARSIGIARPAGRSLS